MLLRQFFVALLCLGLSACTTIQQTSVKESPLSEKAQPQRFILNKGLQVSLTPPSGFSLSAEHYGFVQQESFSRIKVYEIEIPYHTYLAELNQENFARNKLQLVQLRDVDVANAVCKQLTLKQVIAGNVFDKQLLVCGDELSSVVVEASYPESASNVHKQVLFESLLSLNVNADKTLRLFTGLPFTLNDTPGYKITKRFLNSVVLQPLSDLSGKSSLVISHGVSEYTSVDKLSKQLISQGSTEGDIEILTNEQTLLDNIPALATTAYTNVAGDTYYIKQILSYQNNRFLLVQTRVPKANKTTTNEALDRLLSQFGFK